MVLRVRHDDPVPAQLGGPGILRRRRPGTSNHSGAKETGSEPQDLRRKPPAIVVPIPRPEKPLVSEMHSGLC